MAYAYNNKSEMHVNTLDSLAQKGYVILHFFIHKHKHNMVFSYAYLLVVVKVHIYKYLSFLNVYIV